MTARPDAVTPAAPPGTESPGVRLGCCPDQPGTASSAS